MSSDERLLADQELTIAPGPGNTTNGLSAKASAHRPVEQHVEVSRKSFSIYDLKRLSPEVARMLWRVVLAGVGLGVGVLLLRRRWFRRSTSLDAGVVSEQWTADQRGKGEAQSY